MTKGKDKNPFKFQGFSERIANIKLDISHRVEKRTSEPEEKETFCNEALNKWRELNCTIQFQDFCKEIHPLVQTLAQLVHHEQDVVAILHKHLLHEDNSLALEPLLDVVVQISRDLQSDFYPHFKDIFNVFVTLLSRNVLDSEILEHIFTTLGYLFKFLWRYMVKDIKNVFK
jgi:U3 small nucleolar RNA-associated protein 20